ncbi:MAG: HNH endonuclease [Planctomycetota bacterium]
MQGVAEPSAVYTASEPVEPSAIELNATELHRRIVGFQRLSDRFRLEHLKLLAIFDDGRRYLELGYSSTKQYLIQELNVGRSGALELIRIARKLHELPQLAAALGEGEIRWSALKCVSRVATAGTEGEWLAYATTHALEQTQHEVKRAIVEQRDRPAEPTDRGLPNVMSRVSFELTLEEKERFHTAVSRVAESMGPGAPTDLASVVTFISQRILEEKPLVEPRLQTDSPSVSTVDDHSVAPGLTVVYHRYTDGVSTVDTHDGPVRVAAEVVDRIADVAQQVTLTATDVAEQEPLPEGEVDKPNSSTLANKVRKRDGERCANPSCERRHSLHAHHIQFRKDGGRTALCNEITLCSSCHSLVHSGLVKVDRGAHGELVWQRPRAHSVAAIALTDLYPPLASLDAVPAPAKLQAPDVDDLVEGLVTLGYSANARKRLDAAIERLQDDAAVSTVDGAFEVDEETLLREALRNSA